MGNLQKYDSLERDDVDEMDAAFEQRGKPSEYMRLEVGKNVVRFMPPLPGKGKAIRVLQEHYIQLPGLERAVRFACPRLHKKGKCPACERATALSRTGNPIDRKKADDFWPRPRAYVNVIDRRQEDDGPKILAFGKGIWKDLKLIRNDPEEGFDFTDPGPEGLDVIITRVGEGRYDTNYSVRLARTPQPLGNDEWLKEQFDLDTMFAIPTYAQAQQQLTPTAGKDGGQTSTPERQVSNRTASDDVYDTTCEEASA